MCTVSMIMEHYREKWEPRLYEWPPAFPKLNQEPAITDEEIREFRTLLERAREYDKRNNEPDCELNEKRDAIKRIAKSLGVEISFL